MSSMTSRPLDVEEQLLPRRLMDGGGSEQERQLLAAAGRDPLPDLAGPRATGVLQATLAALQEPAPAPIEGSGGAAAASRTLLGGMLAGTVVAAVGLGAILLKPEPAVDARRDVPAPLALTPPAAVVAVPAAPEVPARAVVTPRPLPPARARKAPATVAPRRAPAPATSQAEDGLAAEVRAIEGAQALLGWGQLPQAAAALANYRRRFPAGELHAEADLLEIELAEAGGDSERAARLARALLARPGTSGYRARLAPLLKGGSMAGQGDILERR